MTLKVEFDKKAEKEFRKLDAAVIASIDKFIMELIKDGNPRSSGAQLKGKKLGSLWRYRVGDYRLLCNIEDKTKTVVVLIIIHRRNDYKL